VQDVLIYDLGLSKLYARACTIEYSCPRSLQRAMLWSTQELESRLVAYLRGGSHDQDC
jgi:hypothetical protein